MRPDKQAVCSSASISADKAFERSAPERTSENQLLKQLNKKRFENEIYASTKKKGKKLEKLYSTRPVDMFGSVS